MKTNYLFLAMMAILLIVSCQNEPKVIPSKESVTEHKVVVADTNKNIDIQKQQDTLIDDTVPKDDKSYKSRKVVKKNKVIVKDTNVKSNVDYKTPIETAEDLSSELNNKINTQVNPDNYNGVDSVDVASSIRLIPVFSEKDKSKYFVQVIISVHKRNKIELSKMFPDSQIVYVAQSEGLYKYCLGKFDNQEDAKEYKKQVDKQYNFKDTEVVTFSQAW